MNFDGHRANGSQKLMHLSNMPVRTTGRQLWQSKGVSAICPECYLMVFLALGLLAARGLLR